jgi:phosphate transport system protein
MTEHTHKQFDTEMEAIRGGVLAMGGLVEKQLTRALAALADEDADDLIDAVDGDEQAVNRMQMEIDQQCTQIIAKRQPAAIDLRMIMTVTKVVNDLERIGDEAKKVVFRAKQAHSGGRLAQLRYYDVSRALATVRGMLQAALDAFARLDTDAAAKVVGDDESVDASFQAILRQLISYMMEDPRTIGAALEILFIAKSIERIGDHAKNISEAVVQAVKGIDVRHASAEQIRAELHEP